MNHVKILNTRTVVITPAEAARILQTNIDNNRNVRQTRVREFADTMRKGQWILNGETIKISPDGRLIDGQHRLMACVMSGSSFPVQVAYNVPEEAFGTIDRGAARSIGDMLSYARIQNANHAAAAVRWVTGIENRMIDQRNIRLSPDDVLNFYRDNPDLERSIALGVKYAKSARFCNGSMLSAFHFIFARSNETEANRFIIDLCEGSSLSSGDPVLLLRNMLIRDTRSTKSRKHVGETLSGIINAWNARIEGRTITVIRGSVVSDDGSRRLPIIR